MLSYYAISDSAVINHIIMLLIYIFLFIICGSIGYFIYYKDLHNYIDNKNKNEYQWLYASSIYIMICNQNTKGVETRRNNGYEKYKQETINHDIEHKNERITSCTKMIIILLVLIMFCIGFSIEELSTTIHIIISILILTAGIFYFLFFLSTQYEDAMTMTIFYSLITALIIISKYSKYSMNESTHTESPQLETSHSSHTHTDIQPHQ
jgi:hypothetical protein